MLSADAIDKISELSQSEIQEIDGTKFFVSSKGVAFLRHPKIECVKCFSLTQLVNLTKLIIERDDSKLMINVEDFETVTLSRAKLNENREVDVAGRASFNGMFETFPFEEKLSQEDFIIDVMTKFESNAVTASLIKLVSMVRAEKINTSEDDGISQMVAAKAGVHLTTKSPVKNLWSLTTFKTFPEVDQPEIRYILRLHQRGDEMPTFALYECDGGEWKVELTQVIRDWLVSRLKNELGDKADQVIVL